MSDWPEQAQESANRDMRDTPPEEPVHACPGKDWEPLVEIEPLPGWQGTIEVDELPEWTMAVTVEPPVEGDDN